MAMHCCCYTGPRGGGGQMRATLPPCSTVVRRGATDKAACSPQALPFFLLPACVSCAVFNHSLVCKRIHVSLVLHVLREDIRIPCIFRSVVCGCALVLTEKNIQTQARRGRRSTTATTARRTFPVACASSVPSAPTSTCAWSASLWELRLCPTRTTISIVLW